mmetsp:Transcript_29533/g.36496  ORF Transcript_29533/g.36496 Transcript_29533/m.36496 type:complete len:560 (-) Transcript_29533:810-2489(-)
MKFCTRFEDDLQEVGWEENYLRYRELKEIIKVLTVGKSVNIPSPRNVATKKALYVSNSSSSGSSDSSDDEVAAIGAVDGYCSSESASETQTSTSNISKSASGCELFFAGFQVGEEGSYMEHLRKFARSHSHNEINNNSNNGSDSIDINVSVDMIEIMNMDLDLDYSIVLYFFSCVLNHEVLRVIKFAAVKVDRLVSTFNRSLEKEVEDLLASSKEKMKGMEYILRLSVNDMKTLTAFGVWVDTIHALERFIIINMEAIKKIVKKFNKRAWVLFKPDSGYGTNRRLKPLDDMRILDELSQSLEAVHVLKLNSLEVETRIMCTSSCYHEYLQSHLKQLDTTRTRDKLHRHERQKKFSTRVTKFIDLETRLMPSFLLILAIFLTFFTLICTYYISLGIYVDDDRSTTVFDEKGYFISASIDRAPAANIGTLGLNLSLSFLGIAIFIKHKIVKKALRGKVWMRTHRIACALGIAGIFCGCGVAAFQHQDLPVTHNIFAATFFTFAMLHVLLETVIDYKHRLSSRFLRKIRAATALLVTLCVILFITPMAYLIGVCGGHKCPQR